MTACRIDWNKGVKKVYDFIRGLSPYPAAWTELHQGDAAPVTLKVYESAKIFEAHDLPVGSIVTDQKSYFRVAVPDGYVDILSLQLAGKKKMEVADFLRGFRFTEGTVVR